ncbi:TIGR04076 family protein [Acidobacteriota bacterium]
MDRINRRVFCKTASCAAIGLFCAAELKGKFSKEESLDNKITSVQIKVLSQKGSCGLGHKVGDIASITEAGVDGKICIHALYSMLPAAFAMMFEAQFPWLSDPDTKTHACPDAFNPVVFEITRIRG